MILNEELSPTQDEPLVRYTKDVATRLGLKDQDPQAIALPVITGLEWYQIATATLSRTKRPVLKEKRRTGNAAVRSKAQTEEKRR